jgi:hypothetical protein
MTRRELLLRIGMGAGALVCSLLAVGLALVAVDVARWDDAVRSGDVRYRVSPEEAGLWQPDGLMPGGLGESALGIRDDVAFRRALQALRAAHLDDATASISDPEVAIRKNEAQALLEAVVATESDRSRRSRAAGLLGVLGLARFVFETNDRGALLSSTVSDLQLAIALDPGNDEAKYNLELALQRGRGYQISEGSAGVDPQAGGSGAKGAGASLPGTGY